MEDSVEDSIVSKVNLLSSALQDTSLNIHTLNSKIQAYHHEQNAAVEMLKENVDVCLRHIASGKSADGSSSSQSPTNPWRMIRDKESLIIELEKKNQLLKSRFESAQDRLKEKCKDLSGKLADCARCLAEKETQVAEVEEKLRASERGLQEQQRVTQRAEARLCEVEEDSKKQATKYRDVTERLEKELLSERRKNAENQQSLQAELKQLHLESSSWQEKYGREKQKASQLSEEVAQLEMQLSRWQKLGAQENRSALENNAQKVCFFPSEFVFLG